MGSTYPTSEKVSTINHFNNCKTTHIVYILLCSFCSAFYVCDTKRCLPDWVAEHLYAGRRNNLVYAMVVYFSEMHKDRPVNFCSSGY